MLRAKEIHTFLQENGIAPGDTVLVHTSMRALGEVEGGCDGLIDAFVSYLKDGLFIIPTHTWANVGEEAPHFDVRHTPPCIGALPSVAIGRRDGIRSLHPTHSVVAFGRRAAEFVAGEETATTPAPPHGCWARLIDEDAKILLLGVGLNRNTFLHAVDELLELPDRLCPPISLTVTDGEGRQYTTQFCKHAEHTGSENFGNYEAAFAACGALFYGKLGKAEVKLCYAARMAEVMRHLWERADYDLCREAKEIPPAYYAELLR